MNACIDDIYSLIFEVKADPRFAIPSGVLIKLARSFLRVKRAVCDEIEVCEE
jgi:hypothetical protein